LTQGVEFLNKAGTDQMSVVFRFAIKFLRPELDCNVVLAVKVGKNLECHGAKSETGKRLLEEQINENSKQASERRQKIVNNIGTRTTLTWRDHSYKPETAGRNSFQLS
jgi:hypothetical protein